MKIAIITLGIYPIQMGGVEILSFKQLEKLIKRGHEVVCITKRTPNDRPVASSPTYPVYQLGFSIPIIGPVWFLIAATWRLFRMRRKVDIVHVQYAGYFVIAAYLLRVLTGTPYIVSCQGSDVLVWGRQPVWGHVLKVLLNHASFVTIWSTQMKSTLIQEYRIPANRVEVLPNVIDDDEIEDISSRQAKSKSTKRTVLFLGNLKPVKDPMTAVKAFDIVCRSLSDTRLVLVGDGPCRSQILDYVRANGIEDKVELMGSLTHRDALRTLYNADILVVSSITEGGPMAAMEAMALGVPVVGSSDLIDNGRNGVLVPPRAPEKLAEAIYKVLTDKPFALDLANEAHRRISGLTWASRVSEYEDLYGRMIGNYRHR